MGIMNFILTMLACSFIVIFTYLIAVVLRIDIVKEFVGVILFMLAWILIELKMFITSKKCGP